MPTKETLTTKTNFSYKDIHTLKLKWWRKISHANGQEMKAKVARVTSDEIDLRQTLW